VILSEWLTDTSAILKRAGIESPKSELYLWLSLVTGKDRAYFVTRAPDEMEGFLSRDNLRHLEDILLRRLEREPLAYILGSTSFWGNTIHVGPGVLIPRSDSELVVELGLALSGYLPIPWGQCTNDMPRSPDTFPKSREMLFFMDLCTGSGCLGIAYASHILGEGGTVSGVFTDISNDAIYYAKDNVIINKLKDHIAFFKCDLFPEPSKLDAVWGDKKADLILVNPPYITSGDMDTLMIEVIDFEPDLALRGGTDGLYFYRRILSECRSYMRPGGWIVFEHGYDQGESVPALCRENGLVNVLCFRDYGGQPRVTIAQNIFDTSSKGV